MARRKMKQKRPRRNKNLNLVGLAQGLVVGNAVTQGLFNTNLMQFFTGRGITGPGAAYSGGGDGGQNISLPEILGIGLSNQKFGGISAADKGNFGTALRDNLAANAVPMIGTLILAPIAFKFGKRALRPLLTPVRSALRGSGVTV